jgi:lysophospholipase L1-like esterase
MDRERSPSPAPPRRLAVFGDSIAYGLGARGKTFGWYLSEELGAELLDLSGPALQAKDSVGRAARAAGADLALIAHGSTEAMIRPSERALRLVPARWRKAGGLDPRTYFSSRLRKRVSQRLLSAVLWRYKLLLMRFVGRAQWRTAEEFGGDLERLIGSLDAPRVLVLSPLSIDPRTFPGSPAEFRRYAAVAARVAPACGATFVDLSGCCEEWGDYCDDNFHLTADGHRKVAERLLEVLAAAGPDAPAEAAPA